MRASGGLTAGCLLLANLLMFPHPDRKLAKKPPPPPLKSLFTAPFNALVIGALLLDAGLWMPPFFLEVYARAKGGSHITTEYSVALYNAGSFFGRIIPAALARYLCVVRAARLTVGD